MKHITWLNWYRICIHAVCYWLHYLGITWSEAMIFALEDFISEEPR